MIARISGTLLYKAVEYIVVDTHGIGYRIFVPLTTFYELPETGQAIALNVHTNVKQDAISLFGFYTQEEKDIFLLMLSVNGIGPRLAMNILSGISANDLIRALSQGNLTRLIGIPGVGKKMAERMVVELRDKVIKLDSEQIDELLDDVPMEQQKVKEDALSALVNLGYKRNAARDVIDKIFDEIRESVSLDVLLKESLKILAG
jgi:Holliday junction DNA helicase RuvA